MSDGIAPGVEPRPTGVRWSIFSVACATSALLYLHRYAFSFIKPRLAEEWGLTNTQLGAIDSAFSLCYTLFQIPAAVVADLYGVRLVLAGLIVVWCAGLAMMAWAPSARWMWLAQALLGSGQSAVYACLNRIARTWFPPGVRTTLQGMVGILSGRLGALGSSLFFTTLLLGVCGLHWRTALAILVSMGAGLLIWFLLIFRNSPREHPHVNAQEVALIEGDDQSLNKTAAASKPTLRQFWQRLSPQSAVTMTFLALQTVLSTFADNIYSHWLPLFLSQVHELNYRKMGIYAAMPLLGGAAAGFLGGALNDFLIARTGNRRWSRVAVALGGKSLAGLILLFALQFYDQPYLFCGLLFFVKLCGDCTLATAWGVVTDIGGRATATVFAILNSIAGAGLIAAPIVFGSVADHFGWRAVFVTVSVAYFLCALCWLGIDCTISVMKPESESGTEPESQQ